MDPLTFITFSYITMVGGFRFSYSYSQSIGSVSFSISLPPQIAYLDLKV